MEIKPAGTVLVLSTSLSGGGAEAVARSMVESISGVECAVFENDTGVKVPQRSIRTIGRIRISGSFGKFVNNVWRVFFIQYLKVRVQPLITLSHLEGPNFANLLTCWGDRRIIFVHNRINHSYQQGHFVDWLKKHLVRFLYYRADSIFCVSSDISTELIQDYHIAADRIDVIPNPIDITKIKQDCYRTYGDFRDDVCKQHYLISVASLTAQKNHELLLKAFSRLVRKPFNRPNLKLVLVGDGDQRISLQSLCLELGLSIAEYNAERFDTAAKVLFMGFQLNPYPLLRGAKLFIMPSLWEGLPIALLEAMALGVPSIVSNCSDGVRDIFDLSTAGRLVIDSDGFVRTPYGVLAQQPKTTIDTDSVSLWTNLIGKTLADTEYLGSCKIQAVERVSSNDLIRVKNLWETKVLQQ